MTKTHRVPVTLGPDGWRFPPGFAPIHVEPGDVIEVHSIDAPRPPGRRITVKLTDWPRVPWWRRLLAAMKRL